MYSIYTDLQYILQTDLFAIMYYWWLLFTYGRMAKNTQHWGHPSAALYKQIN